MHWAAYSHRASDEMRRCVINGGGDPNLVDAEGWTPLMWSVVHRGNDTRIAAWLLAHGGADPNIVSTRRSDMHNLPARCSCLDVASVRGLDSCAALLRRYGARRSSSCLN